MSVPLYQFECPKCGWRGTCKSLVEASNMHFILCGNKCPISPLPIGGSPTPHDSHYQFTFKGMRLDPYRILQVYGITHPAQQHAIKKLLRAGKSVKDLPRDIEEVIMALQRWKEMLEEESQNES